MARRIPEHLQELFYAWVLAHQHGFREAHMGSLESLAAKIRILPEGADLAELEAHEVATEAAGWSL